MPIRVVFFGNSATVFSVRHFYALPDTSADLVGVVDVPPHRRGSTNPATDDRPDFVVWAGQHGVPAYEPASPNDPAFVEAMRKLNPDLVIAAGYILILKEEILTVPHLLAANFHASLLPDYRGKHPVFWALRNGEKWAGLTVHAMDPGIDTGDILYQVKVRTHLNDTVAALYDRIMDRSETLVGRLIADASAGNIVRRPQPQGEGAYFSSTTEDDFRIDWNWPAGKIRRYITVTPGKCFADIRGQQVAFLDAGTEQGEESVLPGTLLRLGRARAVVAAGQGAMSLGRVHVGEGPTQTLVDVCRRWGLAPGDRLD